MKLPPLLPGRFIRRDNRFQATVRVGGTLAAAHVANSGRLGDLFVPDRPVWLAPAAAPGRKTAYDLKLVELDGILVSVDARLPNPLFAEALAAGILPELAGHYVEREVRLGDSRLDFRFTSANTTWVETKSVTLVEEGVALFPDVPTSRGSRHLHELIAARAQGDRALVVFVVQRSDAVACRAHANADPVFAKTLREAVASGVQARAFTCTVSQERIAIAGEVPVL
jgi:sugar fermentation stimulation protein A